MFFKKKKTEKRDYDRETLKPVIKSSICTGEKVAGFREKSSGIFHDEMVIRSQADLELFKDTYGITEDLETIY